MNIPTASVKELREQTGAGIMDCRNALIETEGKLEPALQLIKERSLLKVEKKKDRVTSQGLIEAYIHAGGRIGAIVEINCETDFVARTDEFKELAHQMAMQVTAQDPRFISPDEIPDGDDCEVEVACLLCQPYIRDLSRTVQDVINETIAKLGENIQVSHFTRFELGSS